MQKTLAIGLLIFLSACVPKVETDPNFDTLLKIYARCNKAKSLEFAKQNSDPYALAMAAEASCGEASYYLMESMNSTSGPGYALRTMDILTKNAVNGNLSTIIEYRSRQQ